MPAAVCGSCHETWQVRSPTAAQPTPALCPSCRADTPTVPRLAVAAGTYRAAINHAIGALRTGRHAEALAVLESAIQ